MSTTNNIVFAEAMLTVNGIELGYLQECSIEVRGTWKKARGASHIWAVAEALAEAEGTLRASWLRLQAQGLKTILGGTTTYAANKTTLTVLSTDIPSPFEVVIKSPSDGSDGILTLKRVVPTAFTIPWPLRDFVIPNFEAEIYRDANDTVYTIELPGYQSVN